MLTLLINEDKPLDGLYATTSPIVGGIGFVPPVADADQGQSVSVKTFKRVAGVITDSFETGDVLHIGIGDGINAPVCYVSLSSASPAVGTLPINTTGMVALFADTAANLLKLQIAVARTRRGYTNTIFSGDVVIKRSAINPETAVPTPSILGTGVAAALLLPVNTAGGFVVTTSLNKLPALDGSLLTNLPASGGTVTSVAQSFTGGLISVAGSPITASGTLALTVAGTSGGVVYFSSATTWASSAFLAANALMIGGGAGQPPSTVTTGAGVLDFLGNPSSTNLRAVVTDETGTGALVFSHAPRFTGSIDVDGEVNASIDINALATNDTQAFFIRDNNDIGTISISPTKVRWFVEETSVTSVAANPAAAGEVDLLLPPTAGTLALTTGNISGNAATATALATGRTIGASGDATGTSGSFDGTGSATIPLTLATVNGNVGSFGSATQSLTQTVDGKGRITAISAQTVTPAVGSITGLGANVATMLGNSASGTGGPAGTTSPTIATPIFTTTTQTITATATTGNIVTSSGTFPLSRQCPAQLRFEQTGSIVGRVLPPTMAASRDWTFPDADTKVPICSQYITFTGPTAARTITIPDAAWTAARADAAQSFTGTQTFSGRVLTTDGVTTFGATAPALSPSSDSTTGISYGATYMYFHLGAFRGIRIITDYPSGTNTAFLSISGGFTFNSAVAVYDTTTIAAAFVTTPQALSGAGAVDLVTASTHVTTTGGSQALTLANGTVGQRKRITHKVDGGDFILTPTTALGFSTYSSTTAGDVAELEYTSAGWTIIARGGTVA